MSPRRPSDAAYLGGRVPPADGVAEGEDRGGGPRSLPGVLARQHLLLNRRRVRAAGTAVLPPRAAPPPREPPGSETGRAAHAEGPRHPGGEHPHLRGIPGPAGPRLACTAA